MHPVQAPGPSGARDLVVGEPERVQLGALDYTVLAAGKCRQLAPPRFVTSVRLDVLWGTFLWMSAGFVTSGPMI
jgi:hypothetical protein